MPDSNPISVKAKMITTYTTSDRIRTPDRTAAGEPAATAIGDEISGREQQSSLVLFKRPRAAGSVKRRGSEPLAVARALPTPFSVARTPRGRATRGTSDDALLLTRHHEAVESVGLRRAARDDSCLFAAARGDGRRGRRGRRRAAERCPGLGGAAGARREGRRVRRRCRPRRRCPSASTRRRSDGRRRPTAAGSRGARTGAARSSSSCCPTARRHRRLVAVRARRASPLPLRRPDGRTTCSTRRTTTPLSPGSKARHRARAFRRRRPGAEARRRAPRDRDSLGNRAARRRPSQ